MLAFFPLLPLLGTIILDVAVAVVVIVAVTYNCHCRRCASHLPPFLFSIQCDGALLGRVSGNTYLHAQVDVAKKSVIVYTTHLFLFLFLFLFRARAYASTYVPTYVCNHHMYDVFVYVFILFARLFASRVGVNRYLHT